MGELKARFQRNVFLASHDEHLEAILFIVPYQLVQEYAPRASADPLLCTSARRSDWPLSTFTLEKRPIFANDLPPGEKSTAKAYPWRYWSANDRCDYASLQPNTGPLQRRFRTGRGQAVRPPLYLNDFSQQRHRFFSSQFALRHCVRHFWQVAERSDSGVRQQALAKPSGHAFLGSSLRANSLYRLIVMLPLPEALHALVRATTPCGGSHVAAAPKWCGGKPEMCFFSH